MVILISPAGEIAGLAHDGYVPADGYIVAPLPNGYTDADFEHLVYLDGVVSIDAAAKLAQAQQARIARIKAEAAERIAATEWKLSRARERVSAGWADRADVSAVLAERESIRISSNAAEAAVMLIADVAAVQSFEWEVSAATPEPMQTWLLTKLAFKNRFPRAKWLAAKQAATVDIGFADFFESFGMATHVDLQRADTRASVQSLGVAQVPEAIRMTAPEISAVLDVPAAPHEIPEG